MTVSILVRSRDGVAVRWRDGRDVGRESGGGVAGWAEGHVAPVHDELVRGERTFCGEVALVTRAEVGTGCFRVETIPGWYCRGLSLAALPAGVGPSRERPWAVGFNITVSAGRGETELLVPRRGEGLGEQSGRWHVSVNEGAEPRDFGDADLDVGRVVARGLLEELGVEIQDAQAAQASVVHTVFQCGARRSAGEAGGDIGIAIHVSLGELGWRGADVVRAWRGAVDAWEASEATVMSREELVEGLRRGEREWVSWAPTCWEGALEVLSAAAEVRPDEVRPDAA